MFQGNFQVGLEFCLVYTVFSWSSLCILPWTLFLLSWHLHRAGLRAVSNYTILFDLIDIFGFQKFLYIESSKVILLQKYFVFFRQLMLSLVWQVRRVLGVPDRVTDIFGNILPLARIFIESEVASEEADAAEVARLGRSDKGRTRK